MKPLTILYHGTDLESFQKIKSEGFKKDCFFSRNLGDAIAMGGEWIFEVVFIEIELPDNWQVRVMNEIPRQRIVCWSKITRNFRRASLNPYLFKLIGSSNSSFQPPYSITEQDPNFLKEFDLPKFFNHFNS